MEIIDFCKIEEEMPIEMDAQEFFKKTKAVLNKILDGYYEAYRDRKLEDHEYPGEDICDNCRGEGVFMDNGQEKECSMDYGYGCCFHRYIDPEVATKNFEGSMEAMYELLAVDKIID